MEEEELDYIDDIEEDVPLEDILRLAEEEEHRCHDLEEKAQKLQEQEELHQREKEHKEERHLALVKLREARSRRATLERSLQETPSSTLKAKQGHRTVDPPRTVE